MDPMTLHQAEYTKKIRQMLINYMFVKIDHDY